jgi:hypothetical protein
LFPSLSCFILCLREIFNHLADRDEKGKKKAIGLQIVGVFLANGLSPWRPDTDVSKDQ